MTKEAHVVNPRRSQWLIVGLSCGIFVAASPAMAQEAAPPPEGGTAEPGAAPATGAEGAELDAEAQAFLTGGEQPVVEPSAEGEEATGEGSAEQEEQEEEEDRGFGHRFQGGLSVLAGTGYHFEIAWGDEDCYMEGESEGQNVCHGRSPVFFDIQASFGVTEGLEVLAEYRIGLIEETYLSDPSGTSFETSNSRPMAVGVGIRYFVSPENRFKFLIGALLDIDFTKGLDVDVTLRPIFGLQIEIIRWMGFFIQASVNLSFIRSFGLAFDVGGGLQFRFP
jgi:hypothetical protein